MKRKTFLLTQLLFVFTIFAGIFAISIKTYDSVIEQTRTRAAAEHHFIATGLLRDITALESRGENYHQGIAALAQTYGSLAKSQGAGISIYNGNALAYSNINEKAIIDFEFKNDNRQIIIDKQDANAAILVAGKLPETYGGYILIYRLDVTAALNEWQEMRTTLFFAGLLLSVFLSIGLRILLNWLFKPLHNISRTSNRIAEGEYGTRLEVKGKDEIANMSANFNHMAEEIERQMGELTASAKNKQQFIDNFAHELKTPLTAIYGYTEYMQKADITENDRQFALGCVLSQCGRMQTIAHQMMELAGLRNGEIKREFLDPAALFLKVNQTMKPKAAKKNIELVFQNELTELYGDAVLLESLLTNLIDNAIKAGSAGSPVFVKAFEETGNSVITVRDQGKGISKDAISQLTQPYYKAEKHRHSKDGGAGLGLAICEQIVMRHDAVMSFSSILGKGTEVKITFTT